MIHDSSLNYTDLLLYYCALGSIKEVDEIIFKNNIDLNDLYYTYDKNILDYATIIVTKKTKKMINHLINIGLDLLIIQNAIESIDDQEINNMLRSYIRKHKLLILKNKINDNSN